MAEIFISHIQEEAPASLALLNYLKACNLESFLSSDLWEIKAGEKWFDRVTRELDDAIVVMLMLSQNSVARPWINFEAGWALVKQKCAIPVCLGGQNKGCLPRPYSDFHAIDLRTEHYKLAKDCMEHVAKHNGDKITFIPPPDISVSELMKAIAMFETGHH